jgi:hypothetical protein
MKQLPNPDKDNILEFAGKVEVNQPGVKIEAIRELPVFVRKIDIDGGNKAKITLELSTETEDAFLALRGVLAMQRAGRVLVSMEPAQADLFD